MTEELTALPALLKADLTDRANRLVLADALALLGRDGEAELLRGDGPVVAYGGGVLAPKLYDYELSDDHDGDETGEVLAGSPEHAAKLVRKAAREWAEGGSWGEEGATVEVRFAVYESADDGAEPVAEDSVEVDIEPDHESLIRRATRGAGCGTDPGDHDWTSEGEGGCDSNPGVWSTGGTSFTFHSHCRDCGLRRVEHTCGSQRNPGEHDTVGYEMPGSWCVECQAEDCDCGGEQTCCVCGEDGKGFDVVETDHGPDYVCGECVYDGGDE